MIGYESVPYSVAFSMASFRRVNEVTEREAAGVVGKGGESKLGDEVADAALMMSCSRLGAESSGS